mmetsp:Transcript_54392/g.117728  ORF Transcript_54392/g.117728 Transcript_54392/m.117728 type:complete len:247 (-) Transcript_54392:563-1303(-)
MHGQNDVAKHMGRNVQALCQEAARLRGLLKQFCGINPSLHPVAGFLEQLKFLYNSLHIIQSHGLLHRCHVARVDLHKGISYYKVCHAEVTQEDITSKEAGCKGMIIIERSEYPSAPHEVPREDFHEGAHRCTQILKVSIDDVEKGLWIIRVLFENLQALNQALARLPHSVAAKESNTKNSHENTRGMLDKASQRLPHHDCWCGDPGKITKPYNKLAIHTQSRQARCSKNCSHKVVNGRNWLGPIRE